MPFEIESSALKGLVEMRYVHDVKIRRALYRHSEAHVVLDWYDALPEGPQMGAGKAAARIGAAVMGADVVLRWRGLDNASAIDCFHGYVTGIATQHHDTRTQLVLKCVSHSKRADLVPRYRAWQACTLGDVCRRVQSGDPQIITIHPDAQSAINAVMIDLSVQYRETDFEYLSRILHAWGIPLAVDDRAGHLVIGKPKVATQGTFPAAAWHWDTISLDGKIVPVDGKTHTASQSLAGMAQQKNNEFNAKIPRVASEYLPRLDDDHLKDQEWMMERVYDSAFHTNTAVYRLVWRGGMFDYSPGATVSFGNAAYLIREVNLTEEPSGGHNPELLSQEFILQEHQAPLQLMARRVVWPTRTFWARVTKNYEADPTRQGRMQVEFDWEGQDSEQNKERCWLPSVTPYAGLKGSGTSGFLSLPEVGERVLVQFLGEWDSDAVILGSVREFARQGFPYDPHETKRWQTPSGNVIALTTRQEGNTDVITIKVQDQLVFQGKIEGGTQTVVMDLFGSGDERIHFQKGGGPTRLDIFCAGEIYMHAGQKLLLEGGIVQIKSLSGAINIDGAPMVKINCGPWGLMPLNLKPYTGLEAQTALKRTRVKPMQKQPVKDFIEIHMVDDTGVSVPNERYRLKMPDGSITEGQTDANGKARHDGIDPGTCQVAFPDRPDSDWKPI